MNITKTTEGSRMRLAIAGRLDTMTAPQLEAVVSGELGGVTELILDLTDLEYISSAGLRVILSAQKLMSRQGSMELCGVNELVMEVFEVTGFADILTIR